MQQLTSITEFETLKTQEMGFALYINDNVCSVGKNIAPKLEKMLATQFPKLKVFQTYNNELPELSAQLSVFVVPTVLVFFDGKLFIQKSKNFSLNVLEHEIERYYQMMFNS